ncbi:Ger(x)C family spore germination protein [Sporosarcina sp. ACRSL]|uniref:Ger(x)C family spore germination protein n=1 Tax=Sporosarcina sp. ACRSL TaxID=2918215 RepID=UPI001EF4D657|nr:Ger(x)C family spore germination protein [Sporosarcina sp. ACRSL]MCG7345244.1 Ger(x)C family spore germination protein [Sporosarcina sp. ACRSL]
MSKRLLPAFLLGLLLLGGCWDEAQYKDITIVPVMGLTNGDKEGEVKAYFSYPTFEEETIKYAQSEGTGVSTRAAREDASHHTMEALDVSHLEVLMISSDMAKKNVYPEIDMFFRTPRNRITSYVAVVEGDMKQYFNPPGDFKSEVANYYPELLRTGVLYTYITVSTMENAAKLLFDETIDLTLPYLIIDENGLPALDGIALFSNNHFTGQTLRKQEAILAGMMKNKLGKYTRLSYEWKEKDSPITVQVIKVNRKLKISDERVKMKFDIDISVDEFPKNDLYKKQTRREAEKFLSAEIKKDFEKVLTTTQEAKSDVFGVGRKVHAFHQDLWKKGDWRETYSTLSIEIDVKVNLKRTSILD